MDGSVANIITTKRKGGRPKKDSKKSFQISVMCTPEEKNLIVEKATSINTTASELLRELGLTGKIDSKRKSIPKEILHLTATLNHLAANLNQVARKRNRGEELNALERAQLQVLSKDIHELAKTIKQAFL